MNLANKIKALYPTLSDADFLTTVKLQNDGEGDYIKEWNHPVLEKPTDEQLKGE